MIRVDRRDVLLFFELFVCSRFVEKSEFSVLFELLFVFFCNIIDLDISIEVFILRVCINIGNINYDV